MPERVERPVPQEEGRRKSEGTGNGARNHGVDPQLRISKNLGIITKFSRQENLRLPMGAGGRKICLRYIYKGGCDRSCTRSRALLQGHTRELVIRFIRRSREAMNKKRKFDGVGDQSSHGGYWDRNVSRFGGGRGGPGGGRDGQNGGGRGGGGGNGSTTNPPHQDGQKNRGGGQNGQEGGRSEQKEKLEVTGSSVRPAVRRSQEKLRPAIRRPQRGQYLGMGTSVRPDNRRPQEKLGPAIGRPQRDD